MKITFRGTAYYQTADAASALNRSVYTVQKWCRQGRFSPIVKISGEYFIAGEAIAKRGNEIAGARRARPKAVAA